jgi:hypothetical protein
MLSHGAAFLLQLATDDLLQLQHLGPSRVKQRECGADLFHWILGVEGAEVEGHQHSFGLAKKVPDSLRLACPSCLELLQLFVSAGQLLDLPFHQPLLPDHQLFLPGVRHMSLMSVVS